MSRVTWRLDIRPKDAGSDAAYQPQSRYRSQKVAEQQAAFWRDRGYDVVIVRES